MPSPSEPKPTIAFDEFLKLELRIGTIKACEPHPNADKLLRIQLDDGTEEGRQICAGIKAFYEPDTLVGKQVLFIANLEPRTIRGEISQGMILAGSDIHEVDEDGKPTERDVVVLRPDKPVKAGSPVS